MEETKIMRRWRKYFIELLRGKDIEDWEERRKRVGYMESVWKIMKEVVCES